MKKRRDELELLLLKNKQSNENAKAFLIIVDMVGFIAGLFTLSFAASDDSTEAMGYEI